MSETDNNKLLPSAVHKTTRRFFLGGVGAAAGLALARSNDWFGTDIAAYSFEELFVALDQSLTKSQRENTFLKGDHPARQLTLTEAVHKAPHIGTLYNRYQVELIRQMYTRMLSSQGQNWMRNTISLEGRFEGSIFKIYSNDFHRASLRNSQVVINGGHYMLRSEDLSGSGYALGGPISYGQQIGNNQYKVEGNAYKAHGDALDRFHQVLNRSERYAAYEKTPPSELMLQISGVGAHIPGVRIGNVSDVAKEVAREMLATLFEGFTPVQRGEAWSAIDENGGVDSLHVAMYTEFGFYQDGTRYSDLDQEQRQKRGMPYIQMWRIEGPALVIHFKGYPHVHAYMNIVRDPTKIAVGEALTEIKRPLGQDGVQRLIAAALQNRANGAPVFYPEILLARLSPGTVSTGSIYTLDPYANRIVMAVIEAEAMSPELIRSLRQQHVKVVSGQRYTIATIEYMLKREDLLGSPEQVSYLDTTIRDELIEFVRDKDLRQFYG